jgi:hypothetical protein
LFCSCNTLDKKRKAETFIFLFNVLRIRQHTTYRDHNATRYIFHRFLPIMALFFSLNPPRSPHLRHCFIASIVSMSSRNARGRHIRYRVPWVLLNT